jgi:spore coat protein U-like protein
VISTPVPYAFYCWFDRIINNWVEIPIHSRFLHFKKKERIMKTNFNQRKIKLAIASAIVVGSVGLNTASHALDTGSITVSATVGDACNITVNGDVAFGSYDGVNTNATAALDAATTITAQCNSGSSARIDLNTGANGDSNLLNPARAMRINESPAEAPGLSYNLYKDTARLYKFGKGGTGGATDQGGLDLATDGSSMTVNVYGRMAAGQVVPAGNYVDTVTVSVFY